MLSLAAQRTYIVFNELFLREYVCVCFGVLFIVVCGWCVPDDQARVVWQVLITLVSGHKSVSNDWSGVRVICDNVVFSLLTGLCQFCFVGIQYLVSLASFGCNYCLNSLPGSRSPWVG